MDIGGDKQVPCLDLPKESNPFLGVRGLRLSLSKPELFRTQIRLPCGLPPTASCKS